MNRKDTNFKFEDHIFLRNITSDVSKIIKRYKHKDGTWIKPELTEKEELIVNTFMLLEEIHEKMNDMDRCAIFLNAFPSNWKMRMQRRDYIIYHLEYYYINEVALHDRILHLTNYIYNLGLQDRHVTLDIIGSNKNVDAEAKQILKQFDKGINGARRLQNQVKHKGKLHEEQLNLAGMYEFVYENDIKGILEPERKLWQLQIRLIYRNCLRDKKAQMKKDRAAIGNLVKMSLDVLYQQYCVRIEEFNK